MTLDIAIILFPLPKIKSKRIPWNILVRIFIEISLVHIFLVFAECNCVSMGFSFLSSQTHTLNKTHYHRILSDRKKDT